MEYITLTKSNFDHEVLMSDRPVLVDFWASWCAPCRGLAPTIDEIAREQEQVKVGKVNGPTGGRRQVQRGNPGDDWTAPADRPLKQYDSVNTVKNRQR